MMKLLRVGIIGAGADRGWARESHVPAVQQLAGVELTAVATSSQETADAAATAFGAKKAYGKATDLFQDRDIDLIAVCVRVPDHRELVLGALAAGKHVYCEWPLGRNLAEAEEMAATAYVAGVYTAIGLQARMNPAVQRARALLEAGAIGRQLSARLYSSTTGFGPKVPAALAFTERGENGATLVTIPGGHTLDLAVAVLGELHDVTALATTQYPEVEIGDDATRQTRSTSDHLLVLARLAEGGALSVEIAGGRPPDTPFRLEVVGEEGVLALDGGAPRGFQSGRLHLVLNSEPQHVNDGETGSMLDTAANVAGVYAAVRDDLFLGTANTPDFLHAVRLTRLLEDVMASARTGTRKLAADWPVQH